MSDYKTIYSDISKDYIDNAVQANLIDRQRYERSKIRESKFNDKWLKQKVNLIDIVNKFVPAIEGIAQQHSEGGVKYDFEGERYIVKCDKVSGYLRIFDKNAQQYCKLDGTPSSDPNETHFKIMRREEMNHEDNGSIG